MAPHNTALHTNLDVDYVIVYRFPETGEYWPIVIRSFAERLPVQKKARQALAFRSLSKVWQGPALQLKFEMAKIFHFWYL